MKPLGCSVPVRTRVKAISAGSATTEAPESSDPRTLKEACELWYKDAEERLEYGTCLDYKRFKDTHIVPYLGRKKLSSLTLPMIAGFDDHMKASGVSVIQRRRVLTVLKGIIDFVMPKGWVAQNVARSMKLPVVPGAKRTDTSLKKDDIPSEAEINLMLGAARGRWRVFLVTAMFTGLGASELRGLRWPDVNLTESKLTVNQRADRQGTLGLPKTRAGHTREVPLPAPALDALREWKLRCPKSADDLVFPSGGGVPLYHANVVHDVWVPLQLKLGIPSAPNMSVLAEEQKSLSLSE